MKHANVAAPLVKVLAAYCTQRVSDTTKDWFTEAMLEAADGIKFAPEGLTFTSEEDKYMDIMEDDVYGLPEVEPDTNFHVEISPDLLDETAQNHRRNPRAEDSTWDTLAGRSLFGTSTVAHRIANGEEQSSTGTKRSAENSMDTCSQGSTLVNDRPVKIHQRHPPSESQDGTLSLTNSAEATKAAATEIAFLKQLLAQQGVSIESSEATVAAMMAQTSLGNRAAIANHGRLEPDDGSSQDRV